MCKGERRAVRVYFFIYLFFSVHMYVLIKVLLFILWTQTLFGYCLLFSMHFVCILYLALLFTSSVLSPFLDLPLSLSIPLSPFRSSFAHPTFFHLPFPSFIPSSQLYPSRSPHSLFLSLTKIQYVYICAYVCSCLYVHMFV